MCQFFGPFARYDGVASSVQYESGCLNAGCGESEVEVEVSADAS